MLRLVQLQNFTHSMFLIQPKKAQFTHFARVYFIFKQKQHNNFRKKIFKKYSEILIIKLKWLYGFKPQPLELKKEISKQITGIINS